MKKSLLAALVLTTFVAQAEIVEPLQIKNALGVDKNLDYTLLKQMGPWDDRNYQLTKKDLLVLPFDDQHLANVPVFFKVQYRKAHPETGKHYPRSLYQNFNGNYGGLLVDGIWYKKELGLGTVRDESYGKVLNETIIQSASNEVALEAGVSGDESAIECNPVNKNNCVAGTNTQNGQTMYYSSDAGVSWTKSQTNPGSSCCDPTVDWSADGSKVYQGDLKRSGSSIGVRWSVSNDQGQTWGPMQDITTSGSDKEFIHVDRSQSSSYKDNIYMTWHDGNVMQFARSTDMGGSFSNPLSFTSEPVGIGSDITTDSAGNVYYFYPSTSNGAGVRMLKSTNGGTSFSSGSQVKSLNGNFDIAIPAMETRKAFIYTSADVDRNNDTIYVAWTDETNSSAGGNNASANQAWIRVAKSTNGGSSWTDCAAPHAIDSDDRFHPWIKVGDDSTVHIGYYDTRHSNNRTGVDFYYSSSTNACSSWTEERFSNQTSSNLTDGQEWGDYNGLSIVMDKLAATWTDNRSSKATFVGTKTITTGGNIAPTASFTQSCSGLSCTFNGSASSDSDGSIAGYSWSIGGSGSTASNTYANYGTYSVTLTVTDNEGATGSSTQSVVLTDPNQSVLTNGVAKTGLADAKSGEQNWTMSIPAGATNLTFNMSGGTGDADLYVRYGSAPTTATYDCRPYVGGNTEACPIATAQTGTYYVMIRAYSAYSGVSLTGSYTAAAANVAPNASFTSSCTDLSCSFNASSSSDSDGSIASYAWSFGGSGSTASNTYGSAGTYSVTLTVTDNDGATDTSTSSVTVTAPPVNVAPSASFTSSCSDLTCSFNASSSSDSDGSISNYSWSFGGSGVSASNTFASAGTYSVTLTVTDNDGATDTSTSSVTVTAPPVANNELSNGVAKTNLAATKDNNLNFTMVVPAGATDLNFAMSGGSGDADLYVRFGSAPTTSNYDCRPYVGGNTESCPISTAQAGTYYVMVRAYSTFSGVSLTGSYTADTGGGGGQSLFSSTSNVTIPDNNTSGATSNISVSRTGQAGNVKITYSVVHTYIGDLKVELVAPNGSTATLRSNSGGSANDINESVDVNAGTTAASGTWGLKVTDSAGQDTGYIDSWSIEFL